MGQNLMMKTFSWKEWDGKESLEITFVEYKLGIMINEDYPLMKYQRQLHGLKYWMEKENDG